MNDVAVAARADAVRRRPLARTLSLPRWKEYEKLLGSAQELGWTVIDLERWIDSGAVSGRVLILRHDVDQHPATALKMADIEARHGVTSTWYFRWRTCSPLVIRRIRDLGGGIGFHYETLTRRMLDYGLSAAEIDASLIASAQDELRREVAAFKLWFGPIESFCAHGDTRVPGVSNQILVQDEEEARFGVRFDANKAVSRHRLGLWLTDRSVAEGRWSKGIDPFQVLRDYQDPVLCLTHPNNWCSGASLWTDRMASNMLGSPSLERGKWRIAVRTGRDVPPSEGLADPLRGPLVDTPQLRGAAITRSFAPVADSLRREILRYYYNHGQRLVSDQGVRTLETNSGLAESRAATLEHVLRQAGVFSVRNRDVLDIGCGFGALALVFATRGAQVTAIDPNASRLTVGSEVSQRHGLPVSWKVGGMDTTDLGRSLYDVAFMNNSLCYVVPRADRVQALTHTFRALRPGGLLVIRDPSRLRLRDQFTGIPLIGMLPPSLARAIARLLRRNRSHVRLLTKDAARRELLDVGFVGVRNVPPPGRSRLTTPFAAYHHLIARRPGPA